MTAVVGSAAICLSTDGNRDGVFTNIYLHPPCAHLKPLSPKPMMSTRRSPSLWPDCVNGETVTVKLAADLHDSSPNILKIHSMNLSRERREAIEYRKLLGFWRRNNSWRTLKL